MIPVTASAVAVFVAFSGFHAYRANESSLHDSLTVNSSLSSQARFDDAVKDGFGWLRDHVRSDETVVNEPNVDGSLWMYPLEGVRPLMGISPIALTSFREKYATSGRVELLDNVARIGEDPRVAELARKYNAGWIFFDERYYPLTRHALDRDALRQNEHISEVFRRGPVHVYRINSS